MAITSKERIDYIKEKQTLEKTIKQLKLDYIVLEEQKNAIELDRDYWKDKYKLLQQGALIYTRDTKERVLTAQNIPNDFESSYGQIIPIELKNALETKLYALYPFGKVVNGNIEIDKEEYNKYKGAIVL